MGEKKTTLFEINIEEFEFSPSTRFGDELAETVEELEGKGSKLGLFGSKGETDEGTSDDEDASSGLFSRESEESEDEPLEADDAEATDVEVEDAESEESGSALGLVIGLLFLLVVAAASKKFVGGDGTEEYEEVELSEYEN